MGEPVYGSCGVGRGNWGVGFPNGLFDAKGLFELQTVRCQHKGMKTEEVEAVVPGWKVIIN
jgi:hypothetical protein